MVESFDPDLYRLRKVAEGFFGGIAVRYLSRIMAGFSMFRSVPFS